MSVAPVSRRSCSPPTARCSPSGCAARPPTRARPQVLLDELAALAATQPELRPGVGRLPRRRSGAATSGRHRVRPAGPGRGPRPGAARAVVRLGHRVRAGEAVRQAGAGGQRRRRAGLRGDLRARHGAGDHPRHRRRLRGVLRRRAAAAHGAVARPVRRRAVHRGRLRRPRAQEDRQGEVAGAGAERAGHLRGDGAARPPLHRRRQRQAARPGRARGRTARSCRTSPGCSAASRCGSAPAAPTWTPSRHPFWAENRQDVARVLHRRAPTSPPTSPPRPSGPRWPSTTRPWPAGTCASCSPRTRTAPRR